MRRDMCQNIHYENAVTAWGNHLLSSDTMRSTLLCLLVVISCVLAVSLTPNGKKAGISAGDSYNFVKDHIGWWYDWYVVNSERNMNLMVSRSPTPSKSGTPIGVPMLWGAGKADATDIKRLADFRKIKGTTPPYVLGFEEPDCAAGSGSAGMSVAESVLLWNALIAPMGKRGTLMGSPSMCSEFIHENRK